ncbi:hypothetical protein [Sphingobium xenophagum]|uniref:Lipoprotein n=1 Tax=Sphingobium xenophagum TaxID=121428 RepID=A0A401J640_SPHXE|nr:hypothetical protein [Sphingobium xenophagum]GBH32050.1 hypothetical protein MBESOW_P3311 [Sphingobium xenophagum]
MKKIFFLAAYAATLSACSPHTSEESGYLVQVSGTGLFAKDETFSNAQIMKGGPQSYRDFSERIWKLASQGQECQGASMWHIRGIVRSVTSDGIEFEKITSFRAMAIPEANRIARKSKHPTLIGITFC